jgi:hypothetical protein
LMRPLEARVMNRLRDTCENLGSSIREAICMQSKQGYIVQ